MVNHFSCACIKRIKPTYTLVGLLRSKSTMGTVPYHCQFVVLRSKQCRLWLMRPMREWQSLPHEEQMYVDAARSVVVFSFLLVLLSMASLVIFSSPSFSCLWRRQRQLLRSAAMSSQLSGSISKAFISRLHTSLYLSCGRPRGRLPTASSP